MARRETGWVMGSTGFATEFARWRATTEATTARSWSTRTPKRPGPAVSRWPWSWRKETSTYAYVLCYGVRRQFSPSDSDRLDGRRGTDVIRMLFDAMHQAMIRSTTREERRPDGAHPVERETTPLRLQGEVW